MLEDMLSACVLDFMTQWDESSPLCEFAYNNSCHSSIGMAPFEALYGRRCITPVCWEEVRERSFHGPTLIGETNERVKLIHESMKGYEKSTRAMSMFEGKIYSFKWEIRCF